MLFIFFKEEDFLYLLSFSRLSELLNRSEVFTEIFSMRFLVALVAIFVQPRYGSHRLVTIKESQY